MAKSDYEAELERRILYLETKLKHLTNDLWVTGEENETATASYLEIHLNMEKIIDDRTKELTRAAEELRKSEEKYRRIFENVQDVYYEASLDGTILEISPSIENLSQYKRKELIGMSLYDIYTDTKKREEFLKLILDRGKVNDFEISLSDKDGSKHFCSITTLLEKDEQGKPTKLVGSMRDISERKQSEDERKKIETQLQQVNKMEAITILAGGVAHEFNNALMGVMGNIELLKMDFPKDERQDRYFEAMKGSGHRMSRLTNQLLAYAQGGKYQPRELKLDDFLIETLEILQHELSPEVRVETHFPKDISYIKADSAQMQMLLSAILANSNEAIEDQGFIRITAENKDVDEDFAKQHPALTPGYHVCLTIEDNGKGMSEEAREKVFDPFFTTKFQGRGMGMAAVYGIVKNHDGCIHVDSELGKGTGVQIHIPAIRVGVKGQEPEEVKEPERQLAMGDGTILVIEDEAVLLEINREILERLGYRVLEAKTGRESVDMARTFDGQIDLALLDIKLPDMSGNQVYPLIMEARPDLKVVVCSGYSIDGPARKILDAGAEGFIQKPFLIAALAEKLKAVLEGK